jgi:hypothetical protein
MSREVANRGFKLLGIIIFVFFVISCFFPLWWSTSSITNLKMIYPRFGFIIYFYSNYVWLLHLIITVAFLWIYLNRKYNLYFRLFSSKAWNFLSQDVLMNRVFVSTLFFRLLALIYLIAFSSLLWQIELVSEDGLIPYKEFVEKTYLQEGFAFFTYPSVFWVSQSNWFIYFILILSIIVSIYSILVKQKSILYFLLWFFYLSVVTFGRDLFQFPWDTFLLEIGFLGAIALVSINRFKNLPRLVLYALLLLFFRQWLSMSMAKWLWSDPAWHDLTYMKYYWLNNPSPSPLAWYMYRLPMSMQKLITALSLILELAIPITMLFGRRGRQIAFFISLFISLFIQFTGNFGFFNLLTVVLGLWCLDDRFFKRKLQIKIENSVPESDKTRKYNLFSLSMVSLIITFNLYYIANLFVKQDNHASCLNYSLVQKKGESRWKTASLFHETGNIFSRFRIVSPHGVFKAIPKSRIHTEIWIKTKGKDWRKLKLVKGNDLLDFSFSAPFMNRLTFNFYYHSYGLDFRSGLTNVNPSTYKLNSWMHNLINGINKGSGDIDQLINVNKKEKVEKTIIIQSLYIPDSFNNKFRHKKDLDTVLIIPGQYFHTPFFSLENTRHIFIEKQN